MNNPLRELSKNEWGLWGVSLCIVTVSNFAAGNPDFLTLAATWIGITSLIFAAKGNVWAQLLMIVFSTISVMTSFLAAALAMLRSSYYALGYAANDMVLIIFCGTGSCLSACRYQFFHFLFKRYIRLYKLEKKRT